MHDCRSSIGYDFGYRSTNVVCKLYDKELILKGIPSAKALQARADSVKKMM